MTALHPSTVAAIERLAKAQVLEITRMDEEFVILGRYAAMCSLFDGRWIAWNREKGFGHGPYFNTPLHALRWAMKGAR